MGFFDFFKLKSAEQKKLEQFEKIRHSIIVSERKSMMHQMIIASPHDNSKYDVNPNGFGVFGLEKTNPIPVYGIDNIDTYMDRLRYKYTSQKSGTSTYNPIQYLRTTDDDNSAIGSEMPKHETAARGIELDNIKGVVDVYNLYSIGNQKIGKIYINSYSLKTSNKVPEGFYHRDSIPANQDAKVLMQFARKFAK